MGATLSIGITILPTGIASGEAFGLAVLQPGAVVLSPTGTGSAAAFGEPAVGLPLMPVGIPCAEASARSPQSEYTASSLMRYLLLLLLRLAAFALCAAPLAAAELRLAWQDNSDNETGFKIERAPGSSGTLVWAQIAQVAANITTYTDTALPHAATYSYRVRAYNSSGDSGPSNIVSATTPAPPPAAPTGLLVAPIAAAAAAAAAVP